MPTSYKLDIFGTLVEEPVMNSLYYSGTEPDNDINQAQDLADAWVASTMVTKFLNSCPVDYECQTVQVRGIAAVNGGTIGTPAAFAEVVGNGARAGAVLSNQDGPLITMYPDIAIFLPDIVRVRTNKLFLPGVTDDDAGGDVIVAGLVGVMETLAAAVISQIIVGAGGNYIPVGQVREGLYRWVLPYTVWRVKEWVASQNHRRPS